MRPPNIPPNIQSEKAMGEYERQYARDIDQLSKTEPDLTLKEAVQKAEVSAIDKTDKMAFTSDKLFYRLLVLLLSIIVLAVVIGSIVLVFYGKSNLSDGVIAIGSAAVGALVAIFSQKE